MDKITLYKKDQKGALRIWSIEPVFDELHMEYGIEGGEIQFKSESVEENLSGRDLDEQILSRLNSRVEAKRKQGYVADRQEALDMKNNSNIMGYTRPMLAQRFDKMKGKFDYDGAMIQPKYDGHRCMIVNDGGELVAYSRNGKPITTIDHILNNIVIPEGVTIDGELYIHGMSLQKISSLVKRKQIDSQSLEYRVYDVVLNKPYRERYEFLIKECLFCGLALLSFTVDCETDKRAQEFYMYMRNLNYEGAIIRTNDKGYEDGKRSKSLIKVKANINGSEVIDDEFLVVDILPSKDGWARLVCVTKEGKRFKVSSPGTMRERERVLRERSGYIGRSVRVEYAGLTEERKPFHPVAIEWREKYAE